MRLFHERHFPRPKGLGEADEEECYTAVGRRSGVWLTSEPLSGPLVLAVEADGDLDEYEVTGPDHEHRSFVVPGAVVAGWPDAQASSR
jgi:hypothetical protein